MKQTHKKDLTNATNAIIVVTESQSDVRGSIEKPVGFDELFVLADEFHKLIERF